MSGRQSSSSACWAATKMELGGSLWRHQDGCRQAIREGIERGRNWPRWTPDPAASKLCVWFQNNQEGWNWEDKTKKWDSWKEIRSWELPQISIQKAKQYFAIHSFLILFGYQHHKEFHWSLLTTNPKHILYLSSDSSTHITQVTTPLCCNLNSAVKLQSGSCS